MASTYDIYLVLGIVVLVFAFPAIVNAFSESRAPRLAAIAVLVGGGLIVLAVSQNPMGYTIEEVPRAFTRVIGSFLR